MKKGGIFYIPQNATILGIQKYKAGLFFSRSVKYIWKDKISTNLKERKKKNRSKKQKRKEVDQWLPKDSGNGAQ